MKALAALLLLATAPAAPVDHPRTYLASIVDIPLQSDERFSSFSISTWGVTFKAVCRIPGGWTVKAGGDATPEGVLEGNASVGATWLADKNAKELRDFVLVTLDGPVQRHDVSAVPATFKGHVFVETADTRRRARLTFANVSLKPASRCPTAAP